MTTKQSQCNKVIANGRTLVAGEAMIINKRTKIILLELGREETGRIKGEVAEPWTRPKTATII